MLKLIIGAALSMLLGASITLAQGTTTNGFDWGTGFTSPTSYELSHREQRHGVQTSDGALHVIINVGTTNNALQLYSSFNGGQDWCSTFTFPGTTTGISQSNTKVSTDDVLLMPGTPQLLDVTYDEDSASGGNNGLMYAVLQYSTGASCSNGTLTGTPWSYNSGTGVPSYPVAAAGGLPTSTTAFQQPTLAIDSSGGVWLTSLEIGASGATGIKVYYSSSSYGASFINATGFSFATGQTGYNHAPRLFNIPSAIGSMGLLFQVSNCLYYTPLTLTGSTFTNGSNTELSQSYGGSGTCSLPALQSGIQDTAFSIATDVAGNSYLAFVIQDPSTGLSNGVYTLNFCGAPLSGVTGGANICGPGTAAGTWIGGQYLSGANAMYPTGAVYAKTSLVKAIISGVTTYYSLVFVNDDNNMAGALQDDNLVEYTSLTFQESPGKVDYLGVAPGTEAMNSLVHPQASVVGGLVHFSSFTGGSGYTNGTFPNVSSTGGSGSGGYLSLVVAGHRMTNVYPGESVLTSIGSGYMLNDVLSCCARGTGFTATLGTLQSITSNSQDYNNSRIEAPQYINVTSTSQTMPVWDQYLFDTITSGMSVEYDNSLIYWNIAAVPATN